MGMDVYGTSPNKEVGEYFRASVWTWRPLWEYTIAVDKAYDKKLISKKLAEGGHYNDGEGLKKDSLCKQLSLRLQQSIDDGFVNEYSDHLTELQLIARENNKKIDAKCEELKQRVIKETNNPNIIPRDYPEEFEKEWDNLSAEYNHDDHYPFELDYLKEWIDFLYHCGGFSIN